MPQDIFISGSDTLVSGTDVFVTSTELPPFSVIYDLNAGQNATYANNASQNILYDTSGNDNHAIQNTVANQPTHKKSQINGLPCLTFDGTNDWMQMGSIVKPRTIFAVIKHNTLLGNIANFIANNTNAGVSNQQFSYFTSELSSNLFWRVDIANLFRDAGQRNRSWVGLGEVVPSALLRSTNFRVLAFLVRGSGEGIAEINALASRANNMTVDAVDIAYLAISEIKFTDNQIIQHINTLKTQFAL